MENVEICIWLSKLGSQYSRNIYIARAENFLHLEINLFSRFVNKDLLKTRFAEQCGSKNVKKIPSTTKNIFNHFPALNILKGDRWNCTPYSKLKKVSTRGREVLVLYTYFVCVFPTLFWETNIYSTNSSSQYCMLQSLHGQLADSFIFLLIETT